MMDDSLKACKLNPLYFKAKLRLGEAMVMIGKGAHFSDTKSIDEGIMSMKSALQLCWKMDPSDPRHEQKSVFEK
jgi:hypothetical protein